MITAIQVLTLVLCVCANLVALCALALVTKVHQSIVDDHKRANAARNDLASRLQRSTAKTKARRQH